MTFRTNATWNNVIEQRVAIRCIKIIQDKMMRNGHDTPENLRSKAHIQDILKEFDLTLEKVHETLHRSS